MTRQEELAQAASEEYPKWEEAQCHFIDGAHYADSHPHWISVEEIQPKKDEWFLGYSPLKSPLSSMKIDVYNFISFGQLEAHGITHWCRLPQPPLVTDLNKKDLPPVSWQEGNILVEEEGGEV